MNSQLSYSRCRLNMVRFWPKQLGETSSRVNVPTGDIQGEVIGGHKRSLEDLPNVVMDNILLRLDEQSIFEFGIVSRRMQSIVNEDHLWLSVCHQSWGDKMDLAAWRAELPSAKELFQVLRSLFRLVGLWTHKMGNNGMDLLYVRWNTEGRGMLEFWRVEESHMMRIRFAKLFDVIGGSLKNYRVRNTPFRSMVRWKIEDIIQFSMPGSSSRMQVQTTELTLSGTWLSIREQQFSQLKALDDESDVTVSYAFVSSSSDENSDSDFERESKYEFVRPPNFSSTYEKFQLQKATPEYELAGLWVGWYPQHGWQLLSVHYSEGMIVGTLLKGDRDIPAGEVNFVAHIESKMDGVSRDHGCRWDLRPTHRSDEFNFKDRYEGEGRLSYRSVRWPEWVPGELVTEEGDRFHFIWEGSLDYLETVSFDRVDIDLCFAEKNPDNLTMFLEL